jgi:transposase
LIFERLWQELGIPEILGKLVKDTKAKLTFDFERAVFAIVLQRILAPGSDRAGAKWIHTVFAQGFDGLRLQHFYRALRLLWRGKDKIERALFRRDRNLFNQKLDLVFFDTTSLYFEGRGPEGLAKRGHSKDGHFEDTQVVLGVVMRRDGVPIACEVWPGNTSDVTTLGTIVDALKKRFAIEKVVVVCDRGMVSRRNLQALQDKGYGYIVGVKMRGFVEVREQVLARAGRYRVVKDNLHVKEVHVEDRRYVVCFNPEQAIKDAEDRAAIVESLKKKLASGGTKRLVPNRGYRRFLKIAKGSAEIDERRVEEEKRYDGRYVLRTNTELPADDVALAYRNLHWIERHFRDLKTLLQVRPIFHHLVKDNVKGHIFGCWLALYLVVMLRKRIEKLGETVEWNDLIRDLSQLRAIELAFADQRYLLRTDMTGVANVAFRAAGVKPPPIAQPLAGISAVVPQV